MVRLYRKVAADIRRLVDDDDVDLLTEAPRWVQLAKFGYELALLVAALITVWTLTLDETRTVVTVNVVIWLLFVVDYSVRLFVANDRRDYVRRHIPELIAALPLDVLRVARVLRLIRLVRGVSLAARVIRQLRDVFNMRGLQLSIIVGTVLIVGGGLAAAAVEPNIETAADGLWWSIVTTTTVGYGDISPVTAAGRGIASVLMIGGIGILGLLTGTVAEFFTHAGDGDACSDPDVAHVRERLGSWDELDPAARRRLVTLLADITESSKPAAAEPTATSDGESDERETGAA